MRLLTTHKVAGDAECCGAAVHWDVTIPSTESGEVDLDNWQFNGESGRVDAWLVDAGCDRLFDGTYPGASPLCRIFIGPVQPGQISERVSIPSGPYRVFIQAYTNNTAAAQYTAEIGIYGYNCKFNPAAP